MTTPIGLIPPSTTHVGVAAGDAVTVTCAGVIAARLSNEGTLIVDAQALAAAYERAFPNGIRSATAEYGDLVAAMVYRALQG